MIVHILSPRWWIQFAPVLACTVLVVAVGSPGWLCALTGVACGVSIALGYVADSLAEALRDKEEP